MITVRQLRVALSHPDLEPLADAPVGVVLAPGGRAVFVPVDAPALDAGTTTPRVGLRLDLTGVADDDAPALMFDAPPPYFRVDPTEHGGRSMRAASALAGFRYYRQYGGCIEAADDGDGMGDDGPDILHFCTLAEAETFLREFAAFVDAARPNPGLADPEPERTDR